MPLPKMSCGCILKIYWDVVTVYNSSNPATKTKVVGMKKIKRLILFWTEFLYAFMIFCNEALSLISNYTGMEFFYETHSYKMLVIVQL
jgi:hypothetical protein